MKYKCFETQEGYYTIDIMLPLPAEDVFILTCWWISDIYLFPFFMWECVHAHWNNCNPVVSRHTQRS